jgi:tetratricopeptide (TPR) repeat protein
MTTYSAKELQRIVALPDELIRAMARAGHIAPASGRAREAIYSNSDLLVLRIAAALRHAGISARRVVKALAGIRTQLPIETGRPPAAEDRPAPPSFRKGTRGAHERTREAESHFQAALVLEDSDLPASRAAYMAVLRLHRHHVEARINLGRLLHLDGQLEEAERIYRAARVSNALLSFNLALLLEDMNREDEAVLAYREALALDPSLHDAHFNLSRLHERAERSREALHHLLAYRRHVHRLSPR